ncbi:MAG: glycosyltransferase family 9 protein [Chloroflexi bacterium]|nr:MAG: glycosyltransferase family 9 protein [Chloroflexota bacterium]
MRRLLVMRPDNIGDVIMAGPALRALKENLPGLHLTLLAGPGGSQAAALLPWIDDLLPWRVLWQDLGRLPFDPGREWSLVERLRKGRFDAAIVLTSFSQTPYPAALLCHLAGIPLRAGESREVGQGGLTFALPSAPDALHQVERNLRLVEGLGFAVAGRHLELTIPAEAYGGAARLLEGAGLAPGAPYLLLAPWTSCQARTYFPARFGLAARRLADELDCPVAVVGREGDGERAAEVLGPLGTRAIDLVGATTVAELAALVAGARLALANNTSVLHMADALERPMVITYSGTDLESQWCPRRAPARVLSRPTFCTPCYKFACPYNRECMDFTPEEIVSAALELLAPGGPAGERPGP